MLPKSIYFIIVMTLLICAGCVSFARVDGPYEGKVVDAETNQPIVGAVVFGEWSKMHIPSSHTFYDSYEVLTDQQGYFKIPGQGLLIMSNIDEMSVIIFKAGYSQIELTPWLGLSSWKGNEEVFRDGKAVIRLNRLTMAERQKRGVSLSGAPNNKQRLLIMESNKEMIEIGRPANTILRVE